MEAQSERKVLPEAWRRRVYEMVAGWSEPEQVTAEDVERWHEELGRARAAIRTEVVVDTRPQQMRMLEEGA